MIVFMYVGVRRRGRLRDVDHIDDVGRAAPELTDEPIEVDVVWILGVGVDVDDVRPLPEGRVVRIVAPAVGDAEQVVVQAVIGKPVYTCTWSVVGSHCRWACR
jgi:hypothetical protein